MKAATSTTHAAEVLNLSMIDFFHALSLAKALYPLFRVFHHMWCRALSTQQCRR
jgi:hypothetical protein